MRAPPGARTAQIVALWRSGDLARAARETRNQPAMAERLGMSAHAMNSAMSQARQAGHAIPTYAELRGAALGDGWAEWDDEPTIPRIPAPAISQLEGT